MKITVINWEKKLIEEYETNSIKYEENGISFSMWIEPGHIIRKKIKYNQLLGVSK